ncbi:glycosyltransferase family 4 protein [bacterium]|nr:glycosyltransferase family 4 protein [bacterium]
MLERIALLKHGNALREFDNLVSGRPVLHDSIVSYIEEFAELARGRKALIISYGQEWEGGRRDNIEFLTLPLDMLRAHKNYPGYLLAIRRMLSALRLFKPELIVALGYWMNKIPVARYAKATAAEFLPVETGEIVRPTGLKGRFFDSYIHFLSSDAVKLILSRGHIPGVQLARLGVPREKIQDIYPVYPQSFFIKKPVEKFILDEKRNKLLFVGRLSAEKGVLLLPEIMRQMDGERFVLYIIGEGRMRSRLERFVDRYGLGDRVRLLGARPPDMLCSYLNSCDLLVVPSVTEGIAKVALEGVLCGIPIVASDIEPISFLLDAGKGGILVPAGDADAFAEAIRRVCSSRNERERILENQKLLRERFIRGRKSLTSAVQDFIRRRFGV